MIACLEKEEFQFQVFVQLAIMTGARRGELTGLKFGDFDFNNNRVTIERSAYKLVGQPTQTKAPKDDEIRTIAIKASYAKFHLVLDRTFPPVPPLWD